MLNTLIEWMGQNMPLVGGGVLVFLLLATLIKLVKGTGYSPNKTPRSPKQAKAWAAAAVANNDYKSAGEFYLIAGEFDEACNAYARAGLFDDAAEAALAGGMKDRAAIMLEKAKKYVAAAKIYQQQNKFKLAGELFAKAGNETQAAECFEAAGDFLKAGQFFEKGAYNGKAAEAYFKARDFKRAGALFERAYREERISAKDDQRRIRAAGEMAMKAAACFEKVNEVKRAVSMLSDAGFYEKAAGILRQREDWESAADLYVKANLPLQAADIYSQMGDMERAARLKADVLRQEGNELAAAESYRQAGENFEAAEIYRRHARYGEAAACYLALGDYLQAGEMFLRAKEPRKAAEAWERGGDYRRAAEVYQRLGDGKKQSELLERSGEYYEAGFNYYSQKLIDDALRALGNVPKEHPSFKKSCVLLGDIYRERGNATMAVKKYQEAIDGEKVNQGNLHPYYNLARVLEESGDPRLALALYMKIQAEDSQFSDVPARLNSLRQRVQQKERTGPPESTTATPVQPRQKKRYTLLSELGRGGMGIVYKAHDSVLDRVVAFKMLPSDLRGNDIAVKNFLREAKAAAGLNHPNIVIVYDTGEEAGNYYIAMEYIEGRTLRDITAIQGKIPLAGLLVISSQLCQALEYAHGRNVVHRDIKGSNIMWTDSKLVKIMDFGLAKVIQEVVNFQTVVGGTPHYMAPEQILGEEIDRRADLYSLGVTLYECATGTVPFPKGDVGYHHIHTPPPDPREFNKELPEAFAKILLKCLEKEPANRYQHAGEIYEDLKKVPVR
jgi:tetratricopeptide (TPR) repeat protein/predicted Ser/Thr protein kinase